MTLFIFDVDDTLIHSFMRKGGPAETYGKVSLLPGRFDAIDSLSEQGSHRFALVTNQGGVAMGYQVEEQVWAKMGLVISHLNCFFGRPFSVHVCFTHPHAKIEKYLVGEGHVDYPRRKPGPGMLWEAAAAHDVDPEQCTFVGDLDTDRQAAEAAGVHYIDATDFFEG